MTTSNAIDQSATITIAWYSPSKRRYATRPIVQARRAASQRAQRQPCRRQQAEHDRRAAQDLRPEHLIEIGDAALQRTATQSEREQTEPRRRQPARIKPAFKSACNRRGH